jgi:tight adherence protein C
MNPETLKLIASGTFGVSAMLFGVVVYQLLRTHAPPSHQYRDVSQRRTDRRLRATQRSPLYRAFLAMLRAPAGAVARLDLAPLRRYVREPYARAGYPGGLDENEVVAAGLVVSVLLAILTAFASGVLLGAQYALLGVAALPVGFLLMVSSFQNQGEAREKKILKAMPYVLDLLVLILRSGTSLNLALARVVADYADHPVGEEFGQVLSEVEMGAPRTEAIRRLAQRLNNPDITALADSMVQSEELGWPLADTLARQADRMASERILAAQAKAGAAGVWVMLPSTLVLLGAVLLLFGPMIVRFMRGGFNLM